LGESVERRVQTDRKNAIELQKTALLFYQNIGTHPTDYTHCHCWEYHSLNTLCFNNTITYNNMNLFQDQGVWGVSVRNYTRSVLEEATRLKKIYSNLIIVVIGEYRCITFQNFPYFM
jgi:hypothetical protein